MPDATMYPLEELVQQLTSEDHDPPTAEPVHIKVAIGGWSEVDTASAGSIVETWRPRDQ